MMMAAHCLKALPERSSASRSDNKAVCTTAQVSRTMKGNVLNCRKVVSGAKFDSLLVTTSFIFAEYSEKNKHIFLVGFVIQKMNFELGVETALNSLCELSDVNDSDIRSL